MKYRALQEELKEVTEKRATAKKLLEADKDYQVVNSELEELKFKYKDLQEIMSHHLVTYFSETGESSLTTSSGETLQVVVMPSWARKWRTRLAGYTTRLSANSTPFADRCVVLSSTDYRSGIPLSPTPLCLIQLFRLTFKSINGMVSAVSPAHIPGSPLKGTTMKLSRDPRCLWSAARLPKLGRFQPSDRAAGTERAHKQTGSNTNIPELPTRRRYNRLEVLENEPALESQRREVHAGSALVCRVPDCLGRSERLKNPEEDDEQFRTLRKHWAWLYWQLGM